jgi:acyl-coenzyme A synthetase/AMP-(fatty) acid ligase
VALKKEATAEELQAYCHDRIASFKVPKVMHFVKEIPKGPTGKVQRRHLTTHFSGQA